jgi:hypothetical protein
MAGDRGIRWDVDQALTWEWLAEDGNPRAEPLSRLEMPTLRVIHAFIDKEIGQALKERDPLRAFRALADLRAVLSDLVAVGRKDFERLLAIADDGLRDAVDLTRAHLVKRYLDPDIPEARALEINAMLVQIIELGAWPDVEKEFGEAVGDPLWARRWAS